MLQWANNSRSNRKYWEYLKLTPYALDKLKCCPAANSGYQLFRQHSLAEALAKKSKYEFVFSCVAYDDRNRILIECLKSSGIKDFTAEWGLLFDGTAKFTTFTHQNWVKWVEQHDKGSWGKWLDYIKGRYEF